MLRLPPFQRLAAALAFVAMLCAGMAATAARAEVYADDPNSQDPNKPLILAVAADLDPIAKSFGCAFAWGQAANGTVTLEFVPKGDDVRKWTRLVTVTVVGLSPDTKAQAQLLARLQSITLENFSSRGHISQQKTGENPRGMPALYFEYDLGSGAAKEFGAVGVFRGRSEGTKHDLAMIVQIQSHKPLAREDADKMRALALPTAKN